jgi:hypothetical protein
MKLLSWIGLFVLTLVGYSIGRVLFSKKHQMAAELSDGIILVLLWGLAATVKPPLSWAAHLFFPVMALIAGIAVTLIAHPSALSEDEQRTQSGESRNILKRLWAGWKLFAFRLGNFQGRLILMLFYFTILIPFGIINTVFRDPLYQRQSERSSYWFELESESKEIQDARRQF